MHRPFYLQKINSLSTSQQPSHNQTLILDVVKKDYFLFKSYRISIVLYFYSPYTCTCK